MTVHIVAAAVRPAGAYYNNLVCPLTCQSTAAIGEMLVQSRLIAQKKTQLAASPSEKSGDFSGNCALVDAIAGHALNYARFRL